MRAEQTTCRGMCGRVGRYRSIGGLLAVLLRRFLFQNYGNPVRAHWTRRTGGLLLRAVPEGHWPRGRGRSTDRGTGRQPGWRLARPPDDGGPIGGASRHPHQPTGAESPSRRTPVARI